MRGSEPFADLLRKLMQEGTGRADWLRAISKPQATPPRDQNKRWLPKELAAACQVNERTVQTWVARKNPQEPSEENLSKLEAVLYGSNPAPEGRKALREAAELHR